MPFINKTKNNLLFVWLILLLFLIDLGQFFLLGNAVVPLLLPVYCMLLCYHQRYIFLILVALLQCLEFFCFYNFFSLTFIYLIPLSILALFFKKYLYPSYLHIISLIWIGAIIQIYAIEGYFLHLWPTNYYTIMRINAILLIAICFSLTLNNWGMQDNRA